MELYNNSANCAITLFMRIKDGKTPLWDFMPIEKRNTQSAFKDQIFQWLACSCLW